MDPGAEKKIFDKMVCCVFLFKSHGLVAMSSLHESIVVAKSPPGLCGKTTAAIAGGGKWGYNSCKWPKING